MSPDGLFCCNVMFIQWPPLNGITDNGFWIMELVNGIKLIQIK